MNLKTIQTGDVVKLTDKEGNLYLYEVENLEVVGPYGNSVKNQGKEAEFTLITCEIKGTMRLIVKCTMSCLILFSDEEPETDKISCVIRHGHFR